MRLTSLSILASATVVLAQHSLTGNLVNGNSNAITKNLFKFIVSNYGKHIISGQQDINSYNWVKSNLGKSPAILGCDFMNYSPSRVERGTTSHEVETAIAHHHSGGIVTFCWHWNAPSHLYDTATEPWHAGMYSHASNFNLGAAMSDTNGNDYKLLVRDIDAIATQLKRLQSAGVPVLWRPLHEAEGGWFWWGRNGDYTACKKLWALMYDRMTNYHGLNNLIWVWNSINRNWYPGDGTVDVVSADLYPAGGDHSPQTSTYNTVKALVNDKKPVALTECGAIPDPGQLQSSNTHWSWFMTWADYVSNGGQNDRNFLNNMFGSAWVLNLDEIGGWKTGGGGGGGGGTTTTKTTTTNGGGGGGSALYGQCGGQGWTGPTTCASGTCRYSNQWPVPPLKSLPLKNCLSLPVLSCIYQYPEHFRATRHLALPTSHKFCQLYRTGEF